jgi:hypothetical protein
METTGRTSKLLSTSLRVAVAGAFAVVPRFALAQDVYGLEHDRGEPSTFFAITHKRDLDAIAPLPPLLRHRGWSALAGDVHFLMRADGFESGFLARVLPHAPGLARLLRPLSLSPVLHLLGIHPITGFQHYDGELWIHAVLRTAGDLAAGEALAPAALHALAAASHRTEAELAALPLSRLLSRRYVRHLHTPQPPGMLAGPVRRQVERCMLAQARTDIANAAAWLRQGGTLYNAPEGQLSPDGRIGPITSGFHWIMRAAPAETRVVPVAIVYDVMTTHRRRMFVDVASAIEDAPSLKPVDLDERLRRAWLSAACFTCTQLASAVLVEQSRSATPVFRREELADAVRERAVQFAAVGRHADPRLLSPEGVRERVDGFLAFAARRRLVERVGGEQWRVLPVQLEFSVPLGEVGYREWPLAYASNEYTEMAGVELDAVPHPNGSHAAAEQPSRKATTTRSH